MKTSFWTKKEIVSLGPNEFGTKVLELLASRHRLVSYLATPAPEPDEIHLNILTQDGEGNLHLLKSPRKISDSLGAFTKDHFQFHCFEREIREQFGLDIKDHPWDKPLRAQENYPFFKLEGKGIHEVGVGPVHAGIIEPGHFRFMCQGEHIHNLEIQLGYQHRGVETLLLGPDSKKLAPLVETIAGDTSIGHTWAYCAAMEKLCGLEPLLEVDLVRGLGLELERVAMHLFSLGGICADVAAMAGSSGYSLLRTLAINTTMLLCGSRFGRGWLRPGEVRFGVDPTLKAEILQNLQTLQRDISPLNRMVLSSPIIRHRLKSLGRLEKDLTQDLGLVGIIARAAGIPMDLRENHPGEFYRKFPIKTVTVEGGDCWARTLLRIKEIDSSLEWMINVLKDGPPLLPWKTVLPALNPSSVTLGLVEGFRGEILHWLETDENGKLNFYKVQDPSLRNWHGLSQCVRGEGISNFPVCNKSFDLSYCGHDL